MSSRPLDPYISTSGVFHDPTSPGENAYHEPVVMRDFAAAIRSEGDATGGDLTYVHNQGSPASVWTITHNLNKYCSVDVVDSGGSVVVPDVHYDSLNAVTITFGSATSGKAYCN